MGYQAGEIPMLNVHGIAVAGGTFPAEIWRQFMEEALRNEPTKNFLLPVTWPTYRDWHGEWQYSGGSYTTPTTTNYYTPTTYYSNPAPATTEAAEVSPPPKTHEKKEPKKKPPPSASGRDDARGAARDDDRTPA